MSQQARRYAAVLPSMLMLLISTGCTGGQPAPPQRTDTVHRATITSGVSASGALSAVSTENLGFPKGGKLTAVRVRVGDRVRAGQVLATVEDYGYRQVLRQQLANLAAQEAALARIAENPSVSAAQSNLDQASSVLQATEDQAAATRAADRAAIRRARKQLAVDSEAKDQAGDAVDALKKACHSASAGSAATNAQLSALAQQALQQLQGGNAAEAAASLAQLSAALRSAGSPGDAATACSQVMTAESARTAAKQRVVADRTAVVSAQQKTDVDAAGGRLAVENAKQGVVAAKNGLGSASADRPFTISQQRAMVTSAEAMVRAARKDVRDTVLRAPAPGTVSGINGVVGEYLPPSTGTTALAPGSRAAIPGSSAVAGATTAGGAKFLVLSDTQRLQAVLPFEESDAAQVKPGQRAVVHLDSLPGVTVRGTVQKVAPSATAISGVITYYVTVALAGSNPGLKDGQTARGTVVTVRRSNVLTVPNAAVHRQGSASTVIVLTPTGDERTVTFRPGVVGPDRTEVLSGLAEGQRVVLPTGSS